MDLINNESVSPYNTSILLFFAASTVSVIIFLPIAAVESATGKKNNGNIGAPSTP